jgi:hypothetical protein
MRNGRIVCELPSPTQLRQRVLSLLPRLEAIR